MQSSTHEQLEQSGPPHFSVDELTNEIKAALEPRFRSIWVRGEVIGGRPASSGHIYFQLKGSRATLPAVLFRGNASRLTRPLKDGDEITCLGNVEVYPPHGKYQLIIQQVQFSGEGELLAQLEALKQKLNAEGLFDPALKRPLPYFPRRVGVITSPTGAAIRDIVRTIHNRFPAQILLAPAPVQGDAAPQALVNALESLARIDDVDVIILGRGGGSLQDLWAFNNEALARAVAACPKVVVSAVGHEIDHLLTDFVADYRAATPTAAGEVVVPDFQELTLWLQEQTFRLGRGLKNTARQKREGLRHWAARLSDPRRLIRERWQQHDHLEARLLRAIESRRLSHENRLKLLTQRLMAGHPAERLQREALAQQNAVDRMKRNWRLLFQSYNNQLSQLTARLKALSPTASLERGYAIVRRSDDGNVLRSHRDVAVDGQVEILLADGALDATVNKVRSKEDSA